jgi:hypothetical protein
MTNFLVYIFGIFGIFGVLLLMGATGYGALGVSDRWIGTGVAAGIGLSIMASIVNTRRLQSSD